MTLFVRYALNTGNATKFWRNKSFASHITQIPVESGVDKAFLFKFVSLIAKTLVS